MLYEQFLYQFSRDVLHIIQLPLWVPLGSIRQFVLCVETMLLYTVIKIFTATFSCFVDKKALEASCPSKRLNPLAAFYFYPWIVSLFLSSCSRTVTFGLLFFESICSAATVIQIIRNHSLWNNVKKGYSEHTYQKFPWGFV